MEHSVTRRVYGGTHPSLGKRKMRKMEVTMHSGSSLSRDGCEHLTVCQLGLWQALWLRWLLNRLKMLAKVWHICQNHRYQGHNCGLWLGVNRWFIVQ